MFRADETIQPFRAFRARRVPSLLGAIVLSALLIACGGESDPQESDENRQFANDPVATSAATDAPTIGPPSAINEQPTATSQQASPEAYLSGRGAPPVVYAATTTSVTALTMTGADVVTQDLDLPDGFEVVGIDASPVGDRAGVLLSEVATGTLAVQFFDAEGASLSPPIPIGPSHPSATPVASPSASPVAAAGVITPSITWEPQGDAVLVSQPHALIQVHADGTSDAIDISGFADTIRGAAWSPMGGMVAIHSEMADGGHRVSLYNLRKDSFHEVESMRTTPGQALDDVTWLPNGSGLVYIAGAVQDGVLMQGQLFAIDLAEGQSRVLATSGQGGPSATMTNFQVSPDGHAVAYVLAARDGEYWTFHSMWVRSLRDEWSIQVPVVDRAPVTHMGWTSVGLVWGQYDSETAYWFRLTPSGRVIVLNGEHLQSARGTPAASPAATPAGSPEATPVAVFDE